MVRLLSRHDPQDPGFAQAGVSAPRWRNSIIATAIFVVLVVGLLWAIPGLHSVTRELKRADPWWVALGVVLELLSCVSFVLLFERVFSRGPRQLTSRLAWSEMAANSLVSAGGTSGLALGAWVLHSRGVPAQRIAERSVFLFLITSAANVGALVLFGIGLGSGLLSGSQNPLLSWLPAGVGALTIAAALAVGWLASREAEHRELHPRMAAWLAPVAGGIRETLRALRRPDSKLAAAVGYWLFDNAALWAALSAFGHAPTFGVVVMAYLVGMLGNELPLPGGVGGVEAGLIGMLVLYGAPATTAAAGVLVYRALSLLIPGLIGAIAFLDLRRLLRNTPPTQPAESTSG
ncbi:MAG TPA: lysylphosphatidylglycerol synthase transmembrane domain-containing protein [Solirubrobacteraceae bacterium]|jgi:uncharacterized membrane protein YbhN (UPF0104 family)|nr:lysylphosphatidylglycerol synthase transmembrane domain-containing protein [Solirubrobacteraceae bacterium]